MVWLGLVSWWIHLSKGLKKWYLPRGLSPLPPNLRNTLRTQRLGEGDLRKRQRRQRLEVGGQTKKDRSYSERT